MLLQFSRQLLDFEPSGQGYNVFVKFGVGENSYTLPYSGGRYDLGRLYTCPFVTETLSGNVNGFCIFTTKDDADMYASELLERWLDHVRFVETTIWKYNNLMQPTYFVKPVEYDEAKVIGTLRIGNEPHKSSYMRFALCVIAGKMKITNKFKWVLPEV